MKMNLDLGQKASYGLNSCCPCPMEGKDDEPRYPYFRIELKGSGPELPKEGTMTIAFKMVEETESERNGKESYSCCLEVREIISVDGAEEAPSKSGSAGTEKALDALVKALSDKKDEEE